MITLENISKRYANGHLALDRVNLHLARGEFVFLTGHSGAGKSTLLKLITALEKPSQGSMIVANEKVHNMPAHRIPFLRRQLGIILQNPRLLMDRCVFDNVALPLVISGLSFRDAQQKIRVALNKVQLHNKEHVYPYELSSGEQQRVAIARAIVNDPVLLLADEPTGNLDPHLSEQIMTLFEEFNQGGTTILIASHDLALIDQLKHRIITLSQGTLS